MKIFQSLKVRLPKIRFRENCIVQFDFVFLNNGFFICLDSRNLILVRAIRGGVLVQGCDRAWRVEGIMDLKIICWIANFR